MGAQGGEEKAKQQIMQAAEGRAADWTGKF